MPPLAGAAESEVTKKNEQQRAAYLMEYFDTDEQTARDVLAFMDVWFAEFQRTGDMLAARAAAWRRALEQG